MLSMPFDNNNVLNESKKKFEEFEEPNKLNEFEITLKILKAHNKARYSAQRDVQIHLIEYILEQCKIDKRLREKSIAANIADLFKGTIEFPEDYAHFKEFNNAIELLLKRQLRDLSFLHQCKVTLLKPELKRLSKSFKDSFIEVIERNEAFVRDSIECAAPLAAAVIIVVASNISNILAFALIATYAYYVLKDPKETAELTRKIMESTVSIFRELKPIDASVTDEIISLHKNKQKSI